MYWAQLLEEADYHASLLEELEIEESRGLSEYEKYEKEGAFRSPVEEE